MPSRPAGGLHHAMRTRAAGFCIYNDVALAVARARDAGHRVLYVDLDVHHGDGTQTLFWDDPEVLTFSIHETGHRLFPGTGMAGRDRRSGRAGHGRQRAAGRRARATTSWWPDRRARPCRPWRRPSARRSSSRSTAATATSWTRWRTCASPRPPTRAPADSSTRSRIAGARDAGWRPGGGGYDAYRVVPRSWAIVWLAQAHRELPAETPADWRERWREEARAFGQAPLPVDLVDAPGSVTPDPAAASCSNLERAEASLAQALRLLGRTDPGERQAAG